MRKNFRHYKCTFTDYKCKSTDYKYTFTDYKCTFTHKQWIKNFNNDIYLYFAACKVGYYKPAGGNSNCYLCPEHSYSNVPHSIECTCDEGFYRSSTDAKTTACTRMYDLNVCSSFSELFFQGYSYGV